MGRYGLPYPLLIGIIGMIFHFSRDWKRALAVMSLFLATGIIIILYLNQYDPQPRERDYSYVGSFFTFSIWIGIGIFATLDKITSKLKEHIEINMAGGALSLLLLILKFCINMHI